MSTVATVHKPNEQQKPMQNLKKCSILLKLHPQTKLKNNRKTNREQILDNLPSNYFQIPWTNTKENLQQRYQNFIWTRLWKPNNTGKTTSLKYPETTIECGISTYIIERSQVVFMNGGWD